MTRPIEIYDLSDELQDEVREIKNILEDASSRLARLPDVGGLSDAASSVEQALSELQF